MPPPSDPLALLARAGVWVLRDEPLADDPAANIARDSALLRAVARGDSPSLIRIWQHGKALVVTRSETRLPRYADAVAAQNAQGWPVVVRDSGGTAVPHDEGVLHFSLIYRWPKGVRLDLDAAYRALCAPVIGALGQMGIGATFGSVPGAYCDGRFNVVVAGRKLTGTAQRLVPLPEGGHAVLAQAMINVETDVVAGTERVNRFYAQAGDPRDYRAEASVSLHELSPAPDLLRTLRRRLAAATGLLLDS